MTRWFGMLVLAVGCTGDPLPQPTVNPPGPPPIVPDVLPDQRFRRPDPVDMAMGDAGDASLDGAVDMVVADAAVDAAPPTPDAAADAALPDCNGDPCLLAVDLTSCDPCPIALPTSVVMERGCTVLFNNGLPLFEYEPAGCVAECPLDALQFCNEAVGAAICEVDRRCVHAR